MDWARVHRQGKRLAGWTVVIVVVVLAVMVAYFGTPYEGSAESIDTVETDSNVTVEETQRGYVLEPADTQPEAGVVFYPGGRVAPNAYVNSLAALVREANVTVVIPQMPLNLAVVDYGVAQTPVDEHAATEVMNRHDSIDRWYVGGHSLGGSMSCRYARDNPQQVEGLMLYASYCDKDISGTDLAVVNVGGSEDTVINWDAFAANRENLPDDAEIEVVTGLNHTQFGSYTGQDDPSGTSFAEAHARLNAVVVPWLLAELNAE